MAKRVEHWRCVLDTEARVRYEGVGRTQSEARAEAKRVAKRCGAKGPFTETLTRLRRGPRPGKRIQ